MNEIIQRLRVRYGPTYTVEAMLAEEVHLLNALAVEAEKRGDFAEQERLGYEAMHYDFLLSELRADTLH